MGRVRAGGTASASPYKFRGLRGPSHPEARGQEPGGVHRVRLPEGVGRNWTHFGAGLSREEPSQGGMCV